MIKPQEETEIWLKKNGINISDVQDKIVYLNREDSGEIILKNDEYEPSKFSLDEYTTAHSWVMLDGRIYVFSKKSIRRCFQID